MMNHKNRLHSVSYAAGKVAAAQCSLLEAADILAHAQDESWRAPDLDTAIRACVAVSKCLATIMGYATTQVIPPVTTADAFGNVDVR